MSHRFILIHDSASVREVLRVALESEGYRVLEAAADRRKGVRLFRERGRSSARRKELGTISSSSVLR